MSTVADLESNPKPIEEDQNTLVPLAPGTAPSIPATSSIAHPTVRKSSSGFTNLKKYLTANKDNNLIGAVAGGAQTQLEGAQKQLQESQQQFQTQLASEKGKLQAAVGEAGKARQYIDTGSQPLIQEIAPAAALEKPKAIRDRWSTDTDESYKAMQDQYNAQTQAYAENQKARDEFAQKANQAAAEKLSQLKNYQYGGPQELGGAAQIAEKQAQLQDYAKATGSELGRGAILQTLFGKTGQYTAGSRNLDNLLLGSNQNNLDKLRALRAQTTGFGENIKQAQQQATSGMGTAKGLVGTEQASNAMAMKTLRDKLYTQLQAEADAANIAGRADAGELSDAELRKNLVDMAGYTLEAQPKGPNVNGSFSNPVAVQMGMITPTPGGALIAPGTPGTTGGQIGLPVQPPGYVPEPIDPETLNYINLNKNLNFKPEDIGYGVGWDRDPTSNLAVNPNRNLIREIGESGGIGHRDWKHTSYGNPNADQTLIGIQNLKPLFSQSYNDNTVESVNKDVLNRRNVLSQILQDDAKNATLTPKERQEVQTAMNDDLLTRLKQTPKMQEEYYTGKFLGGAPAREGLQAVIAYKQLGYDNPIDLANELGIRMGSGWNFLAGGNPPSGWNPKTQSVVWSNGREMPWSQYSASFSAAGWNNNTSIGASAKKLQEKYTLDRLKELGINQYTNQAGQTLGVDPLTGEPIKR